jgi:hypothetical protein
MDVEAIKIKIANEKAKRIEEYDKALSDLENGVQTYKVTIQSLEEGIKPITCESGISIEEALGGAVLSAIDFGKLTNSVIICCVGLNGFWIEIDEMKKMI